MSRRKHRDPYTRTLVKLPERELAESILHMAAPLLERLGPNPAPDEVRSAIALTIRLWNAHVQTSGFWGDPRPGPLARLRRTMCARNAPTELARSFDLLSARWRSEFAFDPRLVGNWSFEANRDGTHALLCEITLPEGVEAHTPPPIEKRIAIAGAFLDEVRIRQGENSFLIFPVERHRGELSADGVAAIHTPMPTAVQLFADGRLAPIGGAPVDIILGGKELGRRVLDSVSCNDHGGHIAVASLIFRRPNVAISG